MFIFLSPMSDIETHYGGSILALAGKNSVAIINDKRLGSGPITVSKSFTKIYQISPTLYIGFIGLTSDGQMLVKKIKKNYNLFKLDEDREMEPKEFAKMVSFILYSKRTMPYYVSGVIAGLTKDHMPYVANLDCIGCLDENSQFSCVGTASKNLYGMSEAIYSENMEEEDLFVAASQIFLNSVDRDCLSGWGAECYVVGKEGYKKREIKGRCD